MSDFAKRESLTVLTQAISVAIILFAIGTWKGALDEKVNLLIKAREEDMKKWEETKARMERIELDIERIKARVIYSHDQKQ